MVRINMDHVNGNNETSLTSKGSDDMNDASDETIVSILTKLLDEIRKSAPNTHVLCQQLLNISTPQRTMDIIVPFLFHRNLPPFSDSDAIQIVGFLTSFTSDDSAAHNHYLVAASKSIRDEIQSHESQSSYEDKFFLSTDLLNVIIHQACSGISIEVVQHCHSALLSACTILMKNDTSNPVSASFILNGIMAISTNAIDTLMAAATNTVRQNTEWSTICIRCLSLVVDIANLNDSSTMPIIIDTKIFSRAIQLLSYCEGDLLLQISILDILYTFVTTCRPQHSKRIQWILQANSDNSNDMSIIKLLLGYVKKHDYRPGESSSYLHGPALRVLISICSKCLPYSEIRVQSSGHDLINDLFVAIQCYDFNSISSNELERLMYVDAVSSFASTSASALSTILDDIPIRTNWLNLSIANSKIKSATLVSIAAILDPNESSYTEPSLSNNSDTDTSNSLARHHNAISDEMCMKLFATISAANGNLNATELLLRFVQSPIHEIRFGTYRLFCAISKYGIGGQILMTQLSFYNDFLIQRNEVTYEGRILKYQLVETIRNNPTLQSLLSNEILSQLDDYIIKGPHYTEVLAWDVMTAQQ